MSVYESYIASIEELKGRKRSAWVVQAFRGDLYFGRWECALGSGRSVGPFADASSAMQFALDSNKSELLRAQQQEAARARHLSALHQPEF